jgi:hypothetical protein
MPNLIDLDKNIIHSRVSDIPSFFFIHLLPSFLIFFSSRKIQLFAYQPDILTFKTFFDIMSQANRPTADDDPATLIDPTDMFSLPETSQESYDPPAQAVEPVVR